MKKNYNDLFTVFEEIGVEITEQQRQKIYNRIDEVLSYDPKVGILGKTGVGKSSLCNALFGEDIFLVDDIESCTRNPQDLILGLGSKGIKLLDVPGVGESRDRDEEYADLYANLLPELDVVLWVLRADDRAFTVDKAFYKDLIKPHIEQDKPFFIVLNQVDKIEPIRTWNQKLNRPSTEQEENISKKIQIVASEFNMSVNKVIPISATEKYNLVPLVDTIIYDLPKDKKITFAKEVKKENISDNTIKEASNSFVEHIIGFAVDFLPIPKAGKTIIKKVAKKVSSWPIWPWNW